MNPLDKFELRETKHGTQEFCFTDLAVACGLESGVERKYRYWLLHNGKVIPPAHELEGTTCLQLTEITAPSVRESRNSRGQDQWTISLETELAPNNKWSNKVMIHFSYDWETGKHSILGVEREE